MKNLLFALLLGTVLACGDKNPLSQAREDLPDDVTFAYLPTDLSRMAEFGAIGGIFNIPKAHGGFTLKNFYSTTPDIPVYAMADGVIYNIRYSTRMFLEPWASFYGVVAGEEYEDYALFIHLTKTAGMHYGHLSKLAPEILQAAGELELSEVNNVEIRFKAGDILAYIGTHPGFDVGLYDTKKEPYFANPDRYSPDYRSAIPFTDYLTPALREEVWKINPRTVEPLGGKINYDVEGTIAGNWFLEGTTSYDESKQLIFARHERYADKVMIADGSALSSDPEPYLWWVFGNEPLPEAVTMGSGKVKYKVATWWEIYQNENTPPDGTVLIEMTAKDRIKYEFFPGKVPEQVNDFSAAVKIYER